MLGNAVFCIIFGMVKKINIYLAIAGAAAFKFIILSTAVRFVVNVPPPAAKALQIPQFILSLVGGVVALIVIKILEKPLGLK